MNPAYRLEAYTFTRCVLTIHDLDGKVVADNVFVGEPYEYLPTVEQWGVNADTPLNEDEMERIMRSHVPVHPVRRSGSTEERELSRAAYELLTPHDEHGNILPVTFAQFIASLEEAGFKELDGARQLA